jgi:hypothetical protein
MNTFSPECKCFVFITKPTCGEIDINADSKVADFTGADERLDWLLPIMGCIS